MLLNEIYFDTFNKIRNFTFLTKLISYPSIAPQKQNMNTRGLYGIIMAKPQRLQLLVQKA